VRKEEAALLLDRQNGLQPGKNIARIGFFTASLTRC
jgi:hypothetical protein